MSEHDPEESARYEGERRSGLTPFVERDATRSGASREELRERIRALIRERNYLREVRDVQLAEHTARLAEMREHADEIQRELDAVKMDRETKSERIETLEAQVTAQREQALHFLELLTDQRRRTAEALSELAALRAPTSH